MQFELSREKVEILREILSNHLSEVRMEMANTDTKEFREFLEKRVNFLEEFVQKLGTGLTAGTESMKNEKGKEATAPIQSA